MILQPKVAKPLSSTSWHLYQRWKICFFFQMKIAAGLEPRDVINYPKIHNKERIQAESDFRKQPSHVEYPSTLSKWLLLQLKNTITSIGVSASRRGKFPSLHLRYLHTLGVNNRPPETTVQRRRRSRITYSHKRNQKSNQKAVENHLEEQQETEGKKNNNKETVSVCISYFSPNPPPKAELRSTSQKIKNTRLGQNFQNPKKEKQTYNTLFSLSFFCPLRTGGEQEKTHQDKTPAEQNDGGRARSEDKTKEALRSEK